MSNNKIVSINVDQIGRFEATEDNPIELLITPVEIGHNWFKQGNREFNGRYVISVEWEHPL